MSGESRSSVAARWLACEGAHVLVALVLLGAIFGVAYGTGHGGFEAGTFALAALAAFAGVAALVGGRTRDRRDEQIARELRELAELHRLALADADGGKPDPKALLLVHWDQGAQNARIERRRPRRLDIDEIVAHERTLALRTLPPTRSDAVDRAIGSSKIHREPSEENRKEFRRKVESYAANLREVLEAYDAYHAERALLVSGRFRVENHGRGPARNVTVVARFPDPFEIVRELPGRPVIPTRPLFHRDQTRLSALLGGDPRLASPDEASIASRAPIASRSSGNVSGPRYREGSAIVEVSVEMLQQSQATGMDEIPSWTLRLPTPGDYRIPWEIQSDELEEPARGEFRLEVVESVDFAPIRSVKELLGEDAGAVQGRWTRRGTRRARLLRMPDLPLTGGCLCGGVRFEVTEPLVVAFYCHCTRCQRRTGTAASASARVAPGSLRVIAGEGLLGSYDPPEGFSKVFCSACGSAMWAQHPTDPDVIAVRLGAFDADPGIRLSYRQFVAYAATWESIPDDGLPRHPERAPG